MRSWSRSWRHWSWGRRHWHRRNWGWYWRGRCWRCRCWSGRDWSGRGWSRSRWIWRVYWLGCLISQVLIKHLLKCSLSIWLISNVDCELCFSNLIVFVNDFNYYEVCRWKDSIYKQMRLLNWTCNHLRPT